MKRKLLVLWMALVVGLALLSMCGSGRVGYQGGYDTALGPTRGGYTQGGGQAGWDTVVVLLSTQTRLSIAGPDTFAYPASASAADQARIIEMNNWVLGRNNKSWRGDGADSARVYRLGNAAGTAGDIPSFCYSEIDSLRPLGLGQKDASGTQVGVFSPVRLTVDSVNYLNLKTNVVTATDSSTYGRPHYELVYVPFESIIPANSTIVSATINVSSSGNWYWVANDSMIVTLMSNPNDNDWYTQKGILSGTNADWAETSWRRQNTNLWGGGSVNANPWVPALSSREKVWDFGTISDWTSNTRTGGDYIPTGTNVPISIANCVQGAITGEVNNGLLLSYHENNPASYTFKHYSWDRLASSTVNNRTPYIVIKYITKRYQKPFGSSDWAFVFQADDLGAIANKAYADTMEARGGKFTMFGFRQYNTLPGLGVVGVNDQTRRLSLAELFDIYSRGNEYGNHSKFHSPSKGYHDRIVASGQGIASAAYDSMVVNFSPNWMYAVADSARALGIINEDMRLSPRYAKSFGAPVSFLEAYAQRVLVDHGYKAWRTLGSTGIYDREKYYSLPNAGYRASADSASVFVSTAARHVVNIREQFPRGTHRLLVGHPDSNSTSPFHLPKVVNNMKRQVFQVRGNDTRVIYTFCTTSRAGALGSTGRGRQR
jgi:hypothetical protein